ncbi:hypothetical protein XENORESO_004592 [Xenotaenia resolanae]|uniref:Uncharacterized protein n=1 Tax=Xenotaenia resolanae TaxID=208358 RepID=A0ABV0WSP9_9TELE
MASDLEVLIFIPTASRSAVNCPSACYEVWLEGSSRTTLSAKRKDEIHWSPNQTPSRPWLRLEILSVKIMNRTGDKGQPCQSPTCIGNRSDLVPAMWKALNVPSKVSHGKQALGDGSDKERLKTPS